MDLLSLVAPRGGSSVPAVVLSGDLNGGEVSRRVKSGSLGMTAPTVSSRSRCLVATSLPEPPPPPSESQPPPPSSLPLRPPLPQATAFFLDSRMAKRMVTPLMMAES